MPHHGTPCSLWTCPTPEHSTHHGPASPGNTLLTVDLPNCGKPFSPLTGPFVPWGTLEVCWLCFLRWRLHAQILLLRTSTKFSTLGLEVYSFLNDWPAAVDLTGGRGLYSNTSIDTNCFKPLTTMSIFLGGRKWWNRSIMFSPASLPVHIIN